MANYLLAVATNTYFKVERNGALLTKVMLDNLVQIDD